MATANEDTGGWDKVEASEGFQEQLGSKRYDGDISGNMSSTDDPAMISMPDESLAADDLSGFREQLPAQDDSDQMASKDFTAFAKEQPDDESS